jgi:hypothetical protein
VIVFTFCSGSLNRSILCAAVTAVALLSNRTEATTLYSSPLTAPPLTVGNLAGQDGWVAHSGAGAVPIQVGASGTTLAQGSSSREDANVSFTPISAGETYFFGFDVVVNGGSTAVYFAHFKDSATDFTVRTFVAPSTIGDDFLFGLSPSGSSPTVTWGTGLAFGSTYRVVGSYSADTLENRLWVDPVSESSTFISATDSAAAAVSAFGLRQAGGDSTQLISNLAVGTSFSDVAAVPEPSTIGLVAAGVGLASVGLLRRRR